MNDTDQRIAPGQPSGPALFAPLSFDELKILRGHLASGWYKQSAVCPARSGPWPDTAGLLDDLHDAHQSATAAWWAAQATTGLAAPEPQAGA